METGKSRGRQEVVMGQTIPSSVKHGRGSGKTWTYVKVTQTCLLSRMIELITSVIPKIDFYKKNILNASNVRRIMTSNIVPEEQPLTFKCPIKIVL